MYYFISKLYKLVDFIINNDPKYVFMAETHAQTKEKHQKIVDSAIFSYFLKNYIYFLSFDF